MFYRTTQDLFDFIYNIGNSYINGYLISKEYKIINLLDNDYINKNLSFGKNTLLTEYYINKMNDINDSEKSMILDKLLDISDKISKTINIVFNNYEDDINTVMLELFSLNDIDKENINFIELLSSIFTSSLSRKYILLYDSSKTLIENYDNVIYFDFNKNLLLKDYNIVINNSIYNIYFDNIKDSLKMEYPIPIDEECLEYYCNNYILYLFSIFEIASYDIHLIVLTKFLPSP